MQCLIPCVENLCKMGFAWICCLKNARGVEGSQDATEGLMPFIHLV